MKRGVGLLAASQEKSKGEVEKEIIAKHMHCSVSTVRRLYAQPQRDPIPARDLNNFAMACFCNAPEIPPKWVEDLFSANGMGPEYVSDVLKQVIEAHRSDDSIPHLSPEPDAGGRSTLPRRPVLDHQRLRLRSVQKLIGRDENLSQVREWLTSAGRFRQPEAQIIVIGGMPGVGKTALAQAVGRDPVVEHCFQDGVLWAELGPKPDVEGWQREWAGLLGMPVDTTLGPEAWLRQYLASVERRVLLILDDVWPGTSFERLMIGGPQCRVLLTSQVMTVADLYEKVQRLPITTLEHSQALALALGLLEREPTEEEREGLKELVEIVGGLPLAIRVDVAAMKSEGVTPVVHQLRLHSEKDFLSAEPGRVRRLEVPGAEPRQSSVPASFRVAYDLLGETDQRRFRALGKLAKSTSFGVQVLAALWDDDVQETRGAARRLVERSLLERVGNTRYHIHGLLHDFAAEMLGVVGEQDVDEAWVDRFQGEMVKRWKWYWPSVPQPSSMPRLSGRVRLARLLKELKETAFRQRYLDLIKSRWKGEGILAEVWVIGLWLHRRARRNLRIGWSITAGGGVVIAIARAVFAVLNQGLGTKEVLGLMLYGWLYYLMYPVAVIFALLTVWTIWINGVDMANFRRLYYLPVGDYEALLGGESACPDSVM